MGGCLPFAYGYHSGNRGARGRLPLWPTILEATAVTIAVMPKYRIGPKRPLRAFLAEWRESKDLTQEQVGGRFDPPVEKGQISKWETGGRQGVINTAVVAEYAQAIGVRDPKRLYSLPPKSDSDTPPSLDIVAAEMEIDPNVVINIMRAVQGRKS